MRLLLSLFLALSQPVFAEHDPHAGHMSAAKAAPLSDGTVRKVDTAGGEVVIQHGPLDSIGMPVRSASAPTTVPWLVTSLPGSDTCCHRGHR